MAPAETARMYEALFAAFERLANAWPNLTEAWR